MTRKPIGVTVPYRKSATSVSSTPPKALPAKRAWVGLTLADKQAFIDQDFGGNRLDAMDYAEKILKERNA